jgi:serine/threonine protein phosphatase PrpC
MNDVKGKFHSVSRTHIGRVRTCNEDSLLERSDIGLWAVSDGMGGHRAGDVASSMVITALGGLAPGNRQTLSLEAREVLAGVNAELFARGSSVSRQQTMGATVVVLGVEANRYFCLWAGDSRLYLFRGGKLTQLTRDHRYVQALLDSGLLTEQEAHNHPRRNVITRAVGVDAKLSLDVCNGPIEHEDIFLLVTDGVTTVCRDEQLSAIIASMSLDDAADEIVRQCLEGGAPDNLSLIFVKRL